MFLSAFLDVLDALFKVLLALAAFLDLNALLAEQVTFLSPLESLEDTLLGLIALAGAIVFLM